MNRLHLLEAPDVGYTGMHLYLYLYFLKSDKMKKTKLQIFSNHRTCGDSKIWNLSFFYVRTTRFTFSCCAHMDHGVLLIDQVVPILLLLQQVEVEIVAVGKEQEAL